MKHIPDTVPSEPVEWVATYKQREGYSFHVRTRLWFEARTAAMQHFGCGPEGVEVVRR